jgi:superfamily II DNA helicase RecQ
MLADPRQKYRVLAQFRKENPTIPITVCPPFIAVEIFCLIGLQALTASATAEVRADIKRILGITKTNLFQRVLPCNRQNLFYEVIHLPLMP